MSGEYWAGWFDHWGEHHHTTDVASNARRIRMDVAPGIFRKHVYVPRWHQLRLHGTAPIATGTNYEPDTTSYDYDAPLNESGEIDA